MSLRFDESQISDQKRLVRGEQLLYARALLRARDQIHHRAWRVLMLPGLAPQGEVAAIRSLMPKAHIVAVDRDPACLEAARQVGVNETVLCELGTTTKVRYASGYEKQAMAEPFVRDYEPVDILSMDLCCGPLEAADLVRIYRAAVSHAGIAIVTFSYGRDVREVYDVFVSEVERGPIAKSQQGRALQNFRLRLLERLRATGLREGLIGRILWVAGRSTLALHSVMVYRGAEMPMCSLLFQVSQSARHTPEKVSVVQVGAGDFELAVTCPDPSTLYDCPEERIAALRRSHAAIKAAYSRTVKQKTDDVASEVA